MAAMAFALSDSAEGVTFVWGVLGLGWSWCAVKLCSSADVLGSCRGARFFSCTGLMKTPALLVKSPSCAHPVTPQRVTKASDDTQADKNFPPRFNIHPPPSNHSPCPVALYYRSTRGTLNAVARTGADGTFHSRNTRRRAT